MNTPHDRLDPTQEREWQAQERGRQEERLGTDPACGDPRIGQYRLLARALRHPPLDPIPADFATRVAARRAAGDDDRLESLLLRGLFVVLGLAAAVVVAVYGGSWLGTARALLPPSDGFNADLLLLLLACIAASTIFEQWRRERADR